MTDYLVRLSVHSPGALASGWVPADEVAVTGSISCRPYAPDIHAARVHAEGPDRIILPEAFSVRLVNGEATLSLRPTDAWWCWEIREQADNGRIRHLSVVDSALVVDYADAVDVDPTTLTPAAAPEAAWWALWNAMAAGTYLVPDPINVGLYIPTEANPMTQDPAHAGLYTIGALA